MIQFSAHPSRGAVITTLSVTLLTSGFLFEAGAGARDFGGGGFRGMGGGGLDPGGYHFGGDDMGGYRGSHPMFGDGARPQWGGDKIDQNNVTINSTLSDSVQRRRPSGVRLLGLLPPTVALGDDLRQVFGGELATR